jgi:hypothetical protein
VWGSEPCVEVPVWGGTPRGSVEEDLDMEARAVRWRTGWMHGGVAAYGVEARRCTATHRARHGGGEWAAQRRIGGVVENRAHGDARMGLLTRWPFLFFNPSPVSLVTFPMVPNEIRRAETTQNPRERLLGKYVNSSAISDLPS